jgi:hypothetical protein
MPDSHLVIGRVIPERKRFGHEGLRLYIKDSEAGVDACVIFGVIDNQLAARIIGNVGDLSNFTLNNIVRQAEQSLLNAYAFIHGEMFEVDIVGIAKDAKDRTDGSLEFHYLDNVDEVIQARDPLVSLEEIWALCQSHAGLYLRSSLNDLRMALRNHADGPFYCYRAMETIRHDIGRRHKIKEKKQQWERMRAVLAVSEHDIDVVKALAEGLRHGEPTRYTGQQWRQVISITWNVVEAYMLFVLEIMRGNDQAVTSAPPVP